MGAPGAWHAQHSKGKPGMMIQRRIVLEREDQYPLQGHERKKKKRIAAMSRVAEGGLGSPSGGKKKRGDSKGREGEEASISNITKIAGRESYKTLGRAQGRLLAQRRKRPIIL